VSRADVLEASRAERLALADLFESLDDEQLATPSLCDAWTVGDVLAHLATPALVSNADIARQFLRTPRFDAAMVVFSEQAGRFSFADRVAALRRTADDPFVPPVLGPGAPLTDAVIHGEDVRVPLGLSRDVPAEHLRTVLDFGVGWRAAPVFVPYRRLRGLRFVADDIGWSHGIGEPVTGPALQVALAIFGRIGATTDLAGDGVAVLRRRTNGA